MPGRPKRAIQEIELSEFRAKCLSLLDEVNKTKTSLRVTRRVKPIADIIPASIESDERDWIGSMIGRMEIAGDIVSPVIDTKQIETLED